MELGLSGKRALVTGASSGIGAAIAEELASEGVAVVIHGRDPAKTEAVAHAVGEVHGSNAVAVALGDITVDDEARHVADAALAAFGGIDILVNCAGGVVRIDNPDWSDVSPDEWLMSFNLNVVSALRLSQHLSPGMIANGWGRIINISSLSGGRFNGMLHDYGSAKAAFDHFSGNLSKSLASHGVTVNAVVPGTILTPQVERWIGTLREQRGWPEDLADNESRYISEFAPQPVPRLGRPRDIAGAVAYLASPRADYITGASLRIDGGSFPAR